MDPTFHSKWGQLGFASHPHSRSEYVVVATSTLACIALVLLLADPAFIYRRGAALRRPRLSCLRVSIILALSVGVAIALTRAEDPQIC